MEAVKVNDPALTHSAWLQVEEKESEREEREK